MVENSLEILKKERTLAIIDADRLLFTDTKPIPQIIRFINDKKCEMVVGLSAKRDCADTDGKIQIKKTYNIGTLICVANQDKLLEYLEDLSKNRKEYLDGVDDIAYISSDKEILLQLLQKTGIYPIHSSDILNEYKE